MERKLIIARRNIVLFASLDIAEVKAIEGGEPLRLKTLEKRSTL